MTSCLVCGAVFSRNYKEYFDYLAHFEECAREALERKDAHIAALEEQVEAYRISQLTKPVRCSCPSAPEPDYEADRLLEERANQIEELKKTVSKLERARASDRDDIERANRCASRIFLRLAAAGKRAKDLRIRCNELEKRCDKAESHDACAQTISNLKSGSEQTQRVLQKIAQERAEALRDAAEHKKRADAYARQIAQLKERAEEGPRVIVKRVPFEVEARYPPPPPPNDRARTIERLRSIIDDLTDEKRQERHERLRERRALDAHRPLHHRKRRKRT